MARIRVLLTELPPLLRAIIESALEVEPDLELVAERAAPARADVVVVAVANAGGESKSRFYDLPSCTRVVAIALDSGRTSLIEFRPHRTELGALSPEGVVRAIRGAAGLERTP